LLACSYAFYAAWDWRFLSLIITSTLVDYVVGLALQRSDRHRVRAAWLVLSLVVNLGLLGIFKYFNFFVASGAELLGFLGIPAQVSVLSIILPVGISFYTFQTLSYSIDVYLRKMEPCRNLLDVALFVGFFPQLVAGPIVRAREFLPQLTRRTRFDNIDVKACLVLFLAGFIKKAVVSDGVAPIVDAYFSDPSSYTAVSAWIGVLLYAVQIYCDFSGYSDMAIASAGLLGYSLRENFRFPYLACNLREFWQRWHMSLSTWLRDYLYIPLGGNRGTRLFTVRNLMITMLLGGLWHGAATQFIVWGAMHGAGLVVQREWSRRFGRGDRPGTVARGVGAVITFYWVCLAWIFFRAPDYDTAMTVVRSCVLFDSPGESALAIELLGLCAGLAAVHWFVSREFFGEWWKRVPDRAFAVGYGVACAAVLPFTNPVAEPFIYFQF
ncbi:MAG: MBOAT family O-acyltransferase, partial [Planctomycetota bacterium]